MFWLFIAVPCLVLLWLVLAYNGLIGLRNICDNAWAGVDVQLKKRCDLVPNLVEVVKGYAAHERQTLDAVISSRAAATRAGSTAERLRYDAALTQGLSRLIALRESYPELRADGQFQLLMRNLTEIEEQLSAARRTLNANVNALNDKCQMFPSNLVAGAFGFRCRDYLQASEGERTRIEVDLS